nr:DoxX family protein [Propionicimonas sp.]
MDIALWIVAGVLALAFVGAGGMKLAQPKEKLAASGMGWVEDFGQGAIRLIGTLEVLAAIGLILPPLVNIAPVLAPLAAVGLVLLMVGAAVTHARRKEPQMIVANLVLLALAAFVAVGRFALAPFGV